MAIWLMPVVAVAPCQCFSPGGQEITSPGRISFFGPPQHCTQPQPDVTIKFCPSGCVCHAVRAPGSNVTKAPRTRPGSDAWNSGSIRTLPVKYSSGPLVEGCEPLLLISIFSIPPLYLRLEMPSLRVYTHHTADERARNSRKRLFVVSDGVLRS